LTSKQSRDVDNARKLSSEIMTAMAEYVQRLDLVTVERSRFKISGRDMNGEVFFLKDTFLVRGNKIQIIKDGKLIDAESKELQSQISEFQDKEIKIDFSSLNVLEKVFGEFDLVC
jgi:hypothetical protein